MYISYQIYRVQFIEPNSNLSLNGMRGILIESRCNYIRYIDKRFHMLYRILSRMTSKKNHIPYKVFTIQFSFLSKLCRVTLYLRKRFWHRKSKKMMATKHIAYKTYKANHILIFSNYIFLLLQAYFYSILLTRWYEV